MRALITMGKGPRGRAPTLGAETFSAGLGAAGACGRLSVLCISREIASSPIAAGATSTRVKTVTKMLRTRTCPLVPIPEAPCLSNLRFGA